MTIDLAAPGSVTIDLAAPGSVTIDLEAPGSVTIVGFTAYVCGGGRLMVSASSFGANIIFI